MSKPNSLNSSFRFVASMKHPFIDLPLLLVSGQARSGTTVLTKALGAHPQVFSNLKESNYLVDLTWSIQRACTMETRRRQLLVSETEFTESFREALWQVLFPTELWKSPAPPLAVSTFSAMRSEVAEFLIKFIPQTRIINIVRNGVEVVASRLAHEHIGKRTFEEHCVAWAAAMDMITWGESKEQFFLIRQEDFLLPEQTQTLFADLFRNLGLGEDSASADFVAAGIINTTRNENDTDATVANLTTRRDRWKCWSSLQRQTFERICKIPMFQLGYEIPWL